jgi:hypothetical protein
MKMRSTIKWVLICIGQLALCNLIYAQTPGTYDATFDPGSGANGFIRAIAVQGDGKIVIGGFFTSFNGVVRNRIARLNVDGSMDETFASGSGVNEAIEAIVVQGDGEIVIGGFFTSFNGVSRNRIARLNTIVSLSNSFDPGSGANEFISAVAVLPEGKLLIVGGFTSYQGFAAGGIARVFGGEIAQQPIAQPTNLIFSRIRQTSYSIEFEAPPLNSSGFVALRREGVPVESVPIDFQTFCR